MRGDASSSSGLGESFGMELSVTDWKEGRDGAPPRYGGGHLQLRGGGDKKGSPARCPFLQPKMGHF